jgi:hypothetical protein
MFIPKSKWLALLATVALAAGPAVAQDNKALISALIQKGILTQDEAQKITDDISKAQAGEDVVTNSADKWIKKLTLTGRFQTQFVDIGTGIANAAANPAATQHFLLRRIYLGTKIDFGDGFTGAVTYDFANVSFDTAIISWKQSDALTIDMGLKKAPFVYEETTSSGSLKSIERSVVTRYFDEPNNGRRLGAASYRIGLYASGTVPNSGVFYSAAITNPERNEYSGDGTSGPAVNGNPGVQSAGNSTNNNFAYYGTLGYSDKFDGGTYKFAVETGYLPDQGGPGATVGLNNSLSLYGGFADITFGDFELQGEYLSAKDTHGVSATQDAKPSGFWIQPSYYFIPKLLEGVLNYSYVNSDGRGVNISDGIRSAPGGGTMNKLSEWYVGGNWYFRGPDYKLQFGYVHGESKDTTTGGTAKATADGVRTQLQVNF